MCLSLSRQGSGCWSRFTTNSKNRMHLHTIQTYLHTYLFFYRSSLMYRRCSFLCHFVGGEGYPESDISTENRLKPGLRSCFTSTRRVFRRNARCFEVSRTAPRTSITAVRQIYNLQIYAKIQSPVFLSPAHATWHARKGHLWYKKRELTRVRPYL